MNKVDLKETLIERVAAVLEDVDYPTANQIVEEILDAVYDSIEYDVLDDIDRLTHDEDLSEEAL